MASLGGEREDADARASERQRQLADVWLLRLEDEPVLAVGTVLAAGCVLDPGVGAHQRERALIVGCAQTVAGAALAAQVGEGALVDDAARVDDGDAVAQFLDLGQLVAGEQDGHALLGQAPDQLAHVAHAGGVEAGGGLVEDQEARPAQQRGGDAKALAHPVRVAAHPVLGAGAELDHVEHLVDAPGGPVTVERGEEFEVLARAQVRVEARRLDEPGDALERVRAVAHGVAVEQFDDALAGRDQAERHAQRGRLAGAVGAEEAVHVAGVHVQVDVIDRHNLVVALDQPARPHGLGLVAHR